MKTLSQVVLRNSALGMAAQLLIKVLSFGFSVLIVRNLGAAEFGQYSAVIAFGVTFAFFADLGLSPYAVREIARLRDAPDGAARANALYGDILALRLVLSGLTIVLVVCAAWLTGRPALMVAAIALNALGLLLYSLQGASEAVLAGYERLDLAAAGKVTYQLAFVVLGGLALALGLGYLGLVAATLAAVAVMAWICLRGARALGAHPGRPDPRRWAGLLKASLPFGLIGFALGLSYKFDSVLLNVFRGDSETGYYNAAYNLIFSVALFSNVLNTSLYPSLSRQSVSDPQGLARSYERALRYLLAAALPVTLGIFILADQLIPFLYTAGYGAAVPALQVLTWVVPLMFVSEFLGYVVLISGQEKRAARAVLASSLVNGVANLLLVPRFGLMAAAVMTVATEALLVGQYIWELRAILRGFDWLATLLRPGTAVLGMGGVTLLLHASLPFWLNAGLSALVYLGLLVALGVVGRTEWDSLRGFRARPLKAEAE